MFLSTNSKGVKRLSLVAGLVAVGYGISFHKPVEYSSFSASIVLINSTDLALWAGTFLLGAWISVRVVAWVVAGFLADRK